MRTIPHRLGSAGNLVLRPAVAPGATPPVAVQLRVSAGGGTCLKLDAEALGGAFVIDLANLPLSPGNYRAGIHYNGGSGWRWSADLILKIRGGC